MPQTVALIVAAGISARFGGEVPKPYLELCGESVLRRCINTFLNHPLIDGVRVVIRREHHALYKQAVAGLTLFPPVVGGDTRQESVRLGLESIEDGRSPRFVLIHDVARPLVPPEVITRVVEGLKMYPAVLPALPVQDTVKRGRDGLVAETLARDGLWLAQTPQGFEYRRILEAHRRFANTTVTDDTALAEMAGIPVHLVAGDAANSKLTTHTDRAVLEGILQPTMETRTGMGFDVHALKPHDADTPEHKRHMRICGLYVPSTHRLEGHSDADVGLHALVDAILGAIGAGDIGMHFSPEDPRWAGADSERFLLHAFELLHQAKGEIVNLDITIICEKPKIAPMREHMAERIAQLLKLDRNRVNVKATTTEKLGFLGRGEGIAAQAIATVRIAV